MERQTDTSTGRTPILIWSQTHTIGSVWFPPHLANRTVRLRASSSSIIGLSVFDLRPGGGHRQDVCICVEGGGESVYVAAPPRIDPTIAFCCCSPRSRFGDCCWCWRRKRFHCDVTRSPHIYDRQFDLYLGLGSHTVDKKRGHNIYDVVVVFFFYSIIVEQVVRPF